jgi:hypothetical protein
MRITIHDYIDISNKTIKEKYNHIQSLGAAREKAQRPIYH